MICIQIYKVGPPDLASLFPVIQLSPSSKTPKNVKMDYLICKVISGYRILYLFSIHIELDSQAIHF